jgi:AcrR family transcriptional regulator
MPKRVDHGARRREIAAALHRVAATSGLQAVTLRSVAAEAGTSMRLVQYYFPTKDELLAFGWQRVVELTAERATAMLAGASALDDPRELLRTYLLCALPTDEHSRMLYAVQMAYFAVDVTRGAQDPDRDQPTPYLARAVSALLSRSRDDGSVPEHLDPHLEAESLTAMAGGLMSGMLVGAFGPERAAAVIDYHLQRLFGGDEPVGRVVAGGRAAH